MFRFGFNKDKQLNNINAVIMRNFKPILFAMFFIASLGITTSCEKCDCDEPAPIPTPTPPDTINRNDIVIEPTNIYAYSYEGYSDICMMIIKSAVNNPTISVTPIHDHVSTSVKKLSEYPDEDGFYNYLVYANFSQNSTDSNRPFQIIAKATIKSSNNADSVTRTLDYTGLQRAKQIYEKFYHPFEYALGKWMLSDVCIINNNTGEYTNKTFIDSDKYLDLPGVLAVKEIDGVDAFGNQIDEERVEFISEQYTCSNLYGSGFVIPDGNGAWNAQLNDDNDGYLELYSNDQSYRMKMIMINSTVMILEYTKDNIIYSYHFNKSDSE